MEHISDITFHALVETKFILRAPNFHRKVSNTGQIYAVNLSLPRNREPLPKELRITLLWTLQRSE